MSSFFFDEMTFNDGPINGRSVTQYSRLYIQEGAVVEIRCKSQKPARESEYQQYYWYGVWFLDYNGKSSDAVQVNSDVFEITDNWEKYHSHDVDGSLGPYVKLVSTLRYTGRIEDNGKYLQCRPGQGSIATTRQIRGSGNNDGALIVLIVRRKFHHR